MRCLLAMDVKFCVGVPSLAKADLKLRENPNITVLEFDVRAHSRHSHVEACIVNLQGAPSPATLRPMRRLSCRELTPAICSQSYETLAVATRAFLRAHICVVPDPLCSVIRKQSWHAPSSASRSYSSSPPPARLLPRASPSLPPLLVRPLRLDLVRAVCMCAARSHWSED